jgi:hypothetical protein
MEKTGFNAGFFVIIFYNYVYLNSLDQEFTHKKHCFKNVCFLFNRK